MNVNNPSTRRGWVLCRWVVAAALGGCGACERSPSPTKASRSREVMGTLATLTAVAADEARAVQAVEAGYARLEDVNRLMSDYIDASEVGRLNRSPAGTRVHVAAETLHCVQRALEFGQVSGGAFDVTCRPLITLWKTAGRQKRLPDEAELERVRALVDCRALLLDVEASTIAFSREGMQLDLGGIAKGYSLDLAAEAMRKAGADGLLIDVGGDVMALGSAPDGRPWRVGVKHPFQDGLIVVLSLSDCSVATSGVQQRFYEIDGKRYSHIVDPRSGRPVEQAPSVTVIARDGITADAWATVFSVLSVEDGRRLIAAGKAPGAEVMWITRSGETPVVEKTDGFDRYVRKPE